MYKLTRRTIVIASITLLAIGVSFAQQSQGGSGQFAQMQEKYKYTFQLMSMVRHIGEIDKDPKYTLTSAQAKQVLAVLKPLRSKPKLTQDQSKQALKDLKKIFTANQLNAMARIKPRPQSGQRPSMGAPGGQARPGGQNRPGGSQANRRRMDPNAMKDFNPFYAKVDSKDEFAKRRAERWNQFFAGLEKKAKGAKPAAPAAKKTKK